MAVIDVSFKSESLLRNVSFKVILPIEENFDIEFRTLYLLHGMFNEGDDWIRRTDIVSLAKEYSLCVVLPNGDNSYYVNDLSCHNLYSDFILELVNFTRGVFPLSCAKSDTFIAGASMGGFGALYNGLRFNDTFSRIACFSPAIYHEIVDCDDIKDSVFSVVNGFLENKFEGSDLNLRDMINDLDVDSIPSIYLYCGVDDYLFDSLIGFKDFLENKCVDFSYCFGSGGHKWVVWAEHLPCVLDWLCKKEEV